MNDPEFQKTVLEQLEANREFQKIVTDQLVRLTQDATESKQDNQVIKDHLEKVESSIVRIENEHGKKIDALFDSREVQNGVNERIFNEFKQLNEKLDRLTDSKILKRIK